MQYDRNVDALLFLTDMKKAKSEEYKKYLEAISEVIKDIMKISIEIEMKLRKGGD